jgi:hypothetical protein
MTYSTDEFVVGANGRVMVAPKGTDGPATSTEDWSEDWADLGAVDANGLKPKRNATIKEIKIWQSRTTVLRLPDGVDISLDFTLLQWNASTVPLAFGGGEWAAIEGHSGEFIYDIPENPEVDERAFGFEWVTATGDHWRLVLPRASLTGQGDMTIVNNDVSPIPVTVGALATSGVSPGYFLSDSAAVDPS